MSSQVASTSIIIPNKCPPTGTRRSLPSVSRPGSSRNKRKLLERAAWVKYRTKSLLRSEQPSNSSTTQQQKPMPDSPAIQGPQQMSSSSMAGSQVLPSPSDQSRFRRSSSPSPDPQIMRLPIEMPSSGKTLVQSKDSVLPKPANSTSVKSSPPPQPSVEQSISTLTHFMNANLIHQKQLKVNLTKISQTSIEFEMLKMQYCVSFSLPQTTSTVRQQTYSQLRLLCARYESFLEVRRQKLEKHQRFLEEAVNAPAVKDSAQLGLAIDLQIEAAKDLKNMQTEKKLKKELELLFHVK